MAEIVPFKGLFYDLQRVGGLERVIGPPYDVIGPEEQAALYAASPYNYVRIMLNRAEPNDNEENNAYTRAASALQTWLADGILREDEAPALYIYQQAFDDPLGGKRLTRTGLLCALKLEPYSAGVVLPHEETRKHAKEDRLRLMRATQANPEPIFGLYEDPQGVAARTLNAQTTERPPDLSAMVDGEDHLLWRIEDPEAISALQQFMQERRIWIADGHHRYETALTYRDERRSADHSAPGSQPYDTILIALVAFNDPGIVVLPTHRLVRNVPEPRLDDLYLQLERYFTVEPVHPTELAERMAAERGEGEHRFGLAMRGRAWLLTLRDEAIMDSAVEDHSAAWKRLDVSILQTLVLERSLGIPAADLATTSDIGYTRDWDEALEDVRSGTWQIALMLDVPTAEEVRDVSAAGDKMPAKSTFFYPKLWSGLILRRIG